ncbi:hypothetical protein RKD55_001798 [Rossellomorea marisflavi]
MKKQTKDPKQQETKQNAAKGNPKLTGPDRPST